MISSYFYDEQFKRFITQFSAIFSNLQVQTGKREDGHPVALEVPVRYGSIDRVVASIKNANTQNKALVLPVMSTYLLGIDLSPQRRKGVGLVDRKTFMPTGGVFPDDLHVVERAMPIPYDLTFELAIYASNSDQMFQILEQLLIVFDPTLQIQVNDSEFDWTRNVNVELTGLAPEENYPIGADRRIIVWNLNFRMETWITPPMNLRQELVKKIIIRFGDTDAFTLNEYDQNGELVPFTGAIWDTMVIEPNHI